MRDRGGQEQGKQERDAGEGWERIRARRERDRGKRAAAEGLGQECVCVCLRVCVWVCLYFHAVLLTRFNYGPLDFSGPRSGI